MPVIESENVLNDCRDLMTNRLRGSLSRMMGNLENVLFDLASREECESGGALYIDAVRELRLKKREIQVRFENRLSAIYLAIVRKLITTDDSHMQEGIKSVDHTLELIDNLNDISILQEPVENTRHECRRALLALDDHINYMVSDLQENEIINPMQPEIIYNAFWESCDGLRCGTEIRLMMLQMFERQVAMDLVSIYDDINSLLDFFLHTEDSISPDTNETENFYRHVHVLEEQFQSNSQLVKRWAQNHIKERIVDQELPDMMESFLMEHWSDLLTDVFCKYSMESLEWERATQVIDDLIECSTMTLDKQSRLNQVWQFPGLIYRLKAGMKVISLPLNIQARFISDLKVFHTQLTDQNLSNNN